jgi:regulator of protease activity HflC (stomatin/prohibitin superfamily)
MTLKLSAEIEQQLQEQATAAGKQPEAYASELIANALRAAQASNQTTAAQLLAPYLEEAKHLRKKPSNMKGLGAEFAEGVAQKLRRQGLKA